MTRFVYVLKEIRACLEAETLTDVQQRLAVLAGQERDRPGESSADQPRQRHKTCAIAPRPWPTGRPRIFRQVCALVLE